MTCPYCLQPKPRTSSAFTQEKDIDTEIERVEDLISRLITERSKLHEKNEMQSPIYSLPAEILALIFKFACPPVDFWGRYGLDRCLDPPEVTYPHTIGVLSAVSTRWHSAVSSMPSLWVSYIADSRDPRLMQMVFARSGNLPVSASFSLRPASYLEQSAIINSIVREHITARIRMLHVRGATRNWLEQHIPRFIHLESLCLEDTWFEIELLSVNSSCTRLALNRITCRVSLAWSKIRVFHLIDIPIDVSLEMLEKCTNLIEFRLKDPAAPGVEGVQLPSSPFILSYLELFEWPVCFNSVEGCAMLQYARMPALQTLIWNCEGAFNGPSDALLESFFDHFSSTLATLQIEGAKIRSGLSMLFHFLTLSGVKHLVFEECSELFIDDVFSKLASEICMSENREMLVLPKLQSIYINDIDGHLDQGKIFANLPTPLLVAIGFIAGEFISIRSHGRRCVLDA
ncbi:hypothetical protein Agabi119p4_2564 [Agaricus bisporus var. burnettii]|uniref:F-box domain-containing protein n=1 Tax=Agaricus bisporus var. burnettii TaxID=192524 RepID=A0A8H7F9E5_AGABI|nr:hypothetical protein Agabi119p4_2564 [Agaricus bisporus var. burnettii]